MRGIVFDLFHTLVDPEDFRPRDSWRLRHIAETLQDPNPRELIMFWKDTYEERTTSPVSGTDIILRYADEMGLEVSNDEQAAITTHLGDYQDVAILQPRDEVLTAVADLAGRYSLALLSNCYAEEVGAWPDSPLAPLFDGAAFSHQIGSRKPDEAAYRAATGLLGLDANECAFVGNGGSDELRGARLAGFGRGVHQNQFNARNGLVSEEEQERRAGQADAQINALDELAGRRD